MPLLVNASSTKMAATATNVGKCLVQNLTNPAPYQNAFGCSAWCFEPNGTNTDTLTLDMGGLYYVYQVHISGSVQNVSLDLKFKGRLVDSWKTMPTGIWSEQDSVSDLF